MDEPIIAPVLTLMSRHAAASPTFLESRKCYQTRVSDKDRLEWDHPALPPLCCSCVVEDFSGEAGSALRPRDTAQADQHNLRAGDLLLESVSTGLSPAEMAG